MVYSINIQNCSLDIINRVIKKLEKNSYTTYEDYTDMVDCKFIEVDNYTKEYEFDYKTYNNTEISAHDFLSYKKPTLNNIVKKILNDISSN